MEKLSILLLILFVDTQNVHSTYIFPKGFNIQIIILIPFCSIVNVYTKEENELQGVKKTVHRKSRFEIMPGENSRYKIILEDHSFISTTAKLFETNAIKGIESLPQTLIF